MNNATAPRHLLPAAALVQGALLFSGFELTETLLVDLYGSRPTAEDGHIVEGVTLTGDKRDITELISRSQLGDMGQWLDFKDDTNPTLRSYAATKKHTAMRGPNW